MIRSRIIGTGRAVPERVLTNEDLAKMVDTSDAWITERTGIRQRHILEESRAASDLAADAGRSACLKAG
ncbi:MAG TPA: 3-oxoacyl-ACP synthase, partial [Polyangia bacterium]|nr:3-oxoacyl-ACP synthase [Polyangia bacterium]